MNVSEEFIRKLVKEELESINEGSEHSAMSLVVANASKLLSAIEKFESNLKDKNPHALSSVSRSLEALKKTLTDMISTPSSYVYAKKRKIVSLRKVD
jgi:hypothetical protein